MKNLSSKITIVNLFAFIGILLLSVTSNAQVGIGTTSPNGILEISSSTQGVVFPSVILTATNVAAPVINPNGGGDPVPGTTVFNTNATFTGSNDVSIGKYYWSGSEWTEQFDKRQSQLYEQDRATGGANVNNDAIGYRASASAGFEDIYGLDNQIFTANYTGTYKILASVNYGPGQINTPDTGDMSAVAGQGMFRLTFDSTNYDKYVNPITMYNNAHSEGTQRYFALYNEPTITIYVSLTAGVTYNFNLAFDQWPESRIMNNAETGNGRGVVGVLSPSTIEITLVD